MEWIDHVIHDTITVNEPSLTLHHATRVRRLAFQALLNKYVILFIDRGRHREFA